jgi:hypothetical protein
MSADVVHKDCLATLRGSCNQAIAVAAFVVVAPISSDTKRLYRALAVRVLVTLAVRAYVLARAALLLDGAE